MLRFHAVASPRGSASIPMASTADILPANECLISIMVTQRYVESYFTSTSFLGLYWLGLSYNSSIAQYVWSDGSLAGNGMQSNDPYAHWSYNHQVC